MFFLIQRNEKSTIASASTQKILRTRTRAALRRVAPDAAHHLDSISQDLIGGRLQRPGAAAAVAFATSSQICSVAAPKRKNRRDRNRKKAPTSKCLCRSLSKKRFRD